VSILAILVGACTNAGHKPEAVHTPPAAASTPSASLSPTATPVLARPPKPWSKPYVVRISSATEHYSLEMIDGSGHVKVRTGAITDPVQAMGQKAITSGTTGVPTTPFALSKTRLYFLDGGFLLHSIDELGRSTGLIHLAVPGARRIGFAVSPDDKRIAVGIINYSGVRKDGTGVVANSIFAMDLPRGGNRVDLYKQSIKLTTTYQPEAYLEWPVGWFGSNLIVNVAHAGSFGYAADYSGYRGRPIMLQAIHVASSSTGHRIESLCDEGFVFQPITSAGSVCRIENYQPTGAGTTEEIISWKGTVRLLIRPSKTGCTYQPGPLSPDGARVALNGFSRGSGGCSVNDAIQFFGAGGVLTQAGVDGLPLAWLDPTHLIYSPGTFNTASGTARILNTHTHATKPIDDEPGSFAAITYGLG
jgi:hypothetical protein